MIQRPGATSGTPTIAVVDTAGNPKAPATNPAGTPHNGILRYASVFGPLQNTPTKPDCSDAIVSQGSPWDTYRTGYDKTGYVQNVLFKFMPAANAYDVGDGLNTAGYRWLRRHPGVDSSTGNDPNNNRDHLSARVDYQLNTKNKLTYTMSREKDWGVTGQTGLADLPAGGFLLAVAAVLLVFSIFGASVEKQFAPTDQ